MIFNHHLLATKTIKLWEKPCQILAKRKPQQEATRSNERQIETRTKFVSFLRESTRKQLEATSGKTRPTPFEPAVNRRVVGSSPT
jgi:hypothetical protein